MITLCPVYVEPSVENEGNEVVRNSRNFDYSKMLDCLSESLRWHSDYVEFLVLTDGNTNVYGHDSFRVSLDNMTVMESFVHLQTLAVKERLSEGKMILTGCDHIVCGDLSNLFNGIDFDVAIGVRKNQGKVNDSLVVVNDGRPDKANDFFKRRLDHYNEMRQDERVWWGSQDSYDKVIRSFKESDLWESKVYDMDGIKVYIYEYGGGWINNFKYKVNGSSEFMDEFMNNLPLIFDLKGNAKADHSYWYKLFKRRFGEDRNN
ncbi:hypothetical protein LCGC14_0351200 [marine sediment metagenome]|uniref:Nucleotide-diphospho-sugar transferase domain-containing protein n=1 Tax=marine sediment metagenome TaxID=412755 RepID=A0A0F9VXW3_9ZZZZ